MCGGRKGSLVFAPQRLFKLAKKIIMSKNVINLVAADMGYGHQRAAYPLLDLGGGEIITINKYEGIKDWEKKYWINSLKSYEKISRLKKIPFLGSIVFSIMDAFQKIQPLYPNRDLSDPTIQQKYFYRWVRKGLGKQLIDDLNKELDHKPFVTTFFVAAYIAESHGYDGDIYCIICDTDASRAWAPLNPESSRIRFMVPSEKVKQRFVMYGVKENNIFVTGFPLPKENIGLDKKILEADLARRVVELDQNGVYHSHYQGLLDSALKGPVKNNIPPITITYAVGGAGAQKEIGVTIMNKLLPLIKSEKICLNLVAGSRLEVKDYFETEAKRSGLLSNQQNEIKGVRIIYSPDKNKYFQAFNECLHDTDILWTKPSELSFYAALGLPIIMAPPVGSQEDFNRSWLLSVGAGIDSEPAEYVDEWLPPLLASGRLARAAMDGYLNAEQMGTYNIENLLNSK